jgi:WD40 repeat protein
MPKLLKKIKGGSSLAINNDESLIYTIARGNIMVYNTKDFNQSRKIKALSNINSIAISNDNKLIAAKNTSGKIAVLTVDDWLIINKYQMEKNEGSNCIFTSDNNYIVDADCEGNIMLVDLKKQKYYIVLKIRGFMINGITYNPKTEEFIFFFIRKYFDEIHFSEGEFISVVWKHPFEENNYLVFELPNKMEIFGKMVYNEKNNNYIAADKNGTIFIFDNYFNIIDKIYSKTINCQRAVVSKNSRYIVLFVKNGFQLCNYLTLELISEYRGVGWPSDALFINNDKTLIISGGNSSLVIDLDCDVVAEERR